LKANVESRVDDLAALNDAIGFTKLIITTRFNKRQELLRDIKKYWIIYGYNG